jgi:hypothetical protein
MQLLFRLFVTFVTGVSAFYFTFWMGGALLLRLQLPFWLALAAAIGAALSVGRYVWIRTDSVQSGLVTAIVYGAFVVGGIGFAAGFFGPIIFSPGANQGPLLGIFITGPLGFIAGAIGGAVHWAVRGRTKAARRGNVPG